MSLIKLGRRAKVAENTIVSAHDGVHKDAKKDDTNESNCSAAIEDYQSGTLKGAKDAEMGCIDCPEIVHVNEHVPEDDPAAEISEKQIDGVAPITNDSVSIEKQTVSFEQVPEAKGADEMPYKQLSNIEARLISLHEKIDQLGGVPQLIQSQIRACTEINDRYRSDIVAPIAKVAIRWYEKIDWIEKEFRKRTLDTARDMRVLDQVLTEILNLGDEVLDSLCAYGIERILPDEGDRFDRDKHHVDEKRKTTNPDMDGKIAECRRYGFQDQATKRKLKVANVVVYEFDEGKTL